MDSMAANWNEKSILDLSRDPSSKSQCLQPIPTMSTSIMSFPISQPPRTLCADRIMHVGNVSGLRDVYLQVTALAMGDYVYIDGGEMALLVNGETTNMPSRSIHYWS